MRHWCLSIGTRGALRRSVQTQLMDPTDRSRLSGISWDKLLGVHPKSIDLVRRLPRGLWRPHRTLRDLVWRSVLASKDRAFEGDPGSWIGAWVRLPRRRTWWRRKSGQGRSSSTWTAFAGCCPMVWRTSPSFNTWEVCNLLVVLVLYFQEHASPTFAILLTKSAFFFFFFRLRCFLFYLVLVVPN